MVLDLPTVRDEGGGGGDRALDNHRAPERTWNGVVTNGNGNGNGNHNNCNAATNRRVDDTTQPALPTTTRKSLSHPLPADNDAFHSPPLRLNSNGTFWPPLKAVPLASYYKLHRVPSLDSLTAMAEAQSDNPTLSIELPQSETAHVEEPQDRSPPPPPNGLHNKLLDHVVRTPGRQPSPQPTHLGVPGPGQHRVLQEQGSGYVAPIFEGKEQQMDQGKPRSAVLTASVS